MGKKDKWNIVDYMSSKKQEELEKKIERELLEDKFKRLQQEFELEKDINKERREYDKQINDMKIAHNTEINNLKMDYEKQINEIKRDGDKTIWKERMKWITILLTLASILVIIIFTKVI